MADRAAPRRVRAGAAGGAPSAAPGRAATPSAARPSTWRASRPSASAAPSGCAPSTPRTPRCCRSRRVSPRRWRCRRGRRAADRGLRGGARPRPRRRRGRWPASCARVPAQEAEIQARLRAAGELVTEAEVAAQRLRDQAAEAELEVTRHRRASGPRCLGRRGRRPWMRSRRRSLRAARGAPGAPARAARPGQSAGAGGVRRGAWPTSRRWRAGVRTWRRRCASCARVIRDTDRQITGDLRGDLRGGRAQLRGAASATSSRAARDGCAWCSEEQTPATGARRPVRWPADASSNGGRGRGGCGRDGDDGGRDRSGRRGRRPSFRSTRRGGPARASRSRSRPPASRPSACRCCRAARSR